MSLNYGTLRTELLTLSHRGAEITDDNLKSFVRKAEGVIARRLRAAEMLTLAQLTETDRSADGIYTLPSAFLEEGIYWRPIDGTAMDKVGLSEIRKYTAAMDPVYYCPLSKSLVEFRGVPGANSTIDYLYFARPAALSLDADVNDILTNHETIYVDAGLSALYTFTQDFELAQAHAGMAEAAIETLNEQAGRLLAGARSEGAYTLSSFGSY